MQLRARLNMAAGAGPRQGAARPSPGAVAARFVPAVLWALAIFALSARSSLPLPVDSVQYLDKLLHAGAYAGLTGLLLFGDAGPPGARAWAWAVVAALYGASDELHQHFVPLRHMDIFDWLADALGATCCSGAWLTLRRRLRG